MTQEETFVVEVTKEEVNIILNGLSAERQTLFLGSTEEQYRKYHADIDLLISRFREARQILKGY